jgi:hypothetical protein
MAVFCLSVQVFGVVLGLLREPKLGLHPLALFTAHRLLEFNYLLAGGEALPSPKKFISVLIFDFQEFCQ